MHPNRKKTTSMKTLHSPVTGLRRAYSILAQRIAIPLFLLGAGLVLVHPCAGQSGTWTQTGSLITGRDDHTATLLPNGQVLVAGGLDSNNFLASAELYDPASGTWTETGSLATAPIVNIRLPRLSWSLGNEDQSCVDPLRSSTYIALLLRWKMLCAGVVSRRGS